MIGDHLAELNDVLGPYAGLRTLTHHEGGVPSLFDARKTGIWRALRSAWRLRQLFGQADLPTDTTCIFDKIGARERFIAGRHKVSALPHASNVYIAYRNLFISGMAEPPLWPTAPGLHRVPRIGIFPGSRVAGKIMPASTITAVTKACHSRHLHPVVYLLDGESSHVSGSRCEVVTVPRRFAAMAEAVQQVSAVISADSMPAHMAEYFGRPVFVATPVPNEYWLPLSSFNEHRWACFGDLDHGDSALSPFLNLFCNPTAV